MKLVLVILFITTFTATFAERVWAEQLVGKRISLPSNLQLVRAQDGKTVRLTAPSKVVLQSPVMAKGRQLLFPVAIGSQNYYLTERQIVQMGVVSQARCDSLKGSAPTTKNRRDLQSVATAASNVRVSLKNLKSPNGNSWAPNCSKFISSNGAIGNWGSAFLQSAQRIPGPGGSALQAMMSPYLWSRVCPGFTNFRPEQKQHFIVVFVATKAMDEATCNPNAYNGRTPNPPGVGFFQLEGQAKLRKARGAGCVGGKTNGVQKSLPISAQFDCAASQMITSQFDKNIPFCTPGGYWQEANRMSGDICQTMRRYPGCGG